MSQLKKIKFSSIDDFKNAVSNGELNNETIWITPDEEKEEVIVATIDDGTGVSVNINGTQRIIYVPMMTDSIIQALGSSNKPKFVYYHEQMCNVIGSSLDTLVMLYYDYATSAVLKLLYNEGYSDPLETTVLGGSSSGSCSFRIHNVTVVVWDNGAAELDPPLLYPIFMIPTEKNVGLITSKDELVNVIMGKLEYNNPEKVNWSIGSIDGKSQLSFDRMMPSAYLYVPKGTGTLTIDLITGSSNRIEVVDQYIDIKVS